MEPFQIHAYEVIPQRLQKNKSDPRGGPFKAGANIKKVLAKYLKSSRLEKRPEVGFKIAGASVQGLKAHEVRGNILNYCFGQSSTANKAALGLAKKLSMSMDDRTPYSLLLLIAYKDQSKPNVRRLVLWAFPKDQAFQFSASKGTAEIKIPKDIFSRNSVIKKGALFEGIKSDASFLHGYVIDQQAQNTTSEAAAYWVNKFLDCEFSLTGIAGTRLLAKTLRATYEGLMVQSDKNQITDSISAAFISRKPKRSLQSYADEYLTGDAKKKFIELSPRESIDTKFDFVKSEFEEKVMLRVFRLEDEVVVSAPFSTIDTDDGSVTTSFRRDQKTLRVSGKVVEETVKPGRKTRKKSRSVQDGKSSA